MAEKEKSAAPQWRNVPIYVSELKRLNAEEGVSDVRTFSITGVVVKAYEPQGEGNRPVGYHVDDGTGVVRVVYFRPKKVKNAAARAADLEDKVATAAATDVDARLSKAYERFAAGTADLVRRSTRAHPIGACVQAVGRLQSFRGENELLAFTVKRATPAQEVEAVLAREERLPKGKHPVDVGPK